MIINSRSPYIITVNEPSQIGSKIELFIWNDTASLPLTPTYTLSKKIASATQTANYYDIANYISEYITNINSGQDNRLQYCNVRVKSYYQNILGTYTLIDTVDYIGVYGYNLYTDGVNKLNDRTAFIKDGLITYYNRGSIPFVTVYSYGLPFAAKYKDLSNANEVVVNYDGTNKFYNIPLSLNDSNYNNGNTLFLDFGILDAEKNAGPFTVIPVCEPKYIPITCTFINRYGGWQFLTFFKAQTNSINVTASNFKLMSNNFNYNTKEASEKVFNVNGKKTVRLNTGWVDENYDEVIQDLLLSETVLLDDKPVKVKSQSLTFKTSIIDKNINYELEFEYAYDLINTIL